jgi:hypothetical protein
MQGIEKLNVYLLFRTDLHRVILALNTGNGRNAYLRRSDSMAEIKTRNEPLSSLHDFVLIHNIHRHGRVRWTTPLTLGC